MECCICQEFPILPVRWICFPCSPVEQIEGSCNTFTVFCKVCSDRFFEFDKKNKTTLKKKCIYCPNERFIHYLTPDKAYSIQLLMMKMDDKIRKCPYLCGYENQHLEVYHHTESSCPNRPSQCPECKEILPFHQMVNHPSTCPEYQKCNICDTYISKKNIKTHFIQDHQAVQCKYCSVFICHCVNLQQTNKKLNLHWKNNCVHEILCIYCGAKVPPKDANTHFKNHYDTMQNQKNQYHNIQKEIENSSITFDRARQLRWIKNTIYDMIGQLHVMQDKYIYPSSMP